MIILVYIMNILEKVVINEVSEETLVSKNIELIYKMKPTNGNVFRQNQKEVLAKILKEGYPKYHSHQVMDNPVPDRTSIPIHSEYRIYKLKVRVFLEED
jgi:hypothetical protein